jgi:hypothetical protein
MSATIAAADRRAHPVPHFPFCHVCVEQTRMQDVFLKIEKEHAQEAFRSSKFD